MKAGIICGSTAGAGAACTAVAAAATGAGAAIAVATGAESSGLAVCSVPIAGGRKEAGDMVGEADSATSVAAAHSCLLSASSAAAEGNAGAPTVCSTNSGSGSLTGAAG
jgi:hypothetical protein